MTVSLALDTAALATLAGVVAVALALVVRGLATAPQTAVATPGAWVAGSEDWFGELPHRLIQLAILLLIGSMASVAVLAGRPPWANLAETAIAFAAAVLIAYLLVERQTGARGLQIPAA